MHSPAMPPQRAPDASYARPSGSFLPPQLLSASAYVAADFGRGRPGPEGIVIVLHGFPNEGLVEFRVEDSIGKLQLANNLIGKIFYLNLGHHHPLE